MPEERDSSSVIADGSEGAFLLRSAEDSPVMSGTVRSDVLEGNDGPRPLLVKTTGATRCVIRCARFDAEPAVLDASWSDIVEVSTPGGPLWLTELTQFDPLISVLAHAGPHRIRVSRRYADDEEELIFEAWPSIAAEATVLRRSEPTESRRDRLLRSSATEEVWALTREIGKLVDQGPGVLSGVRTTVSVTGTAHSTGAQALAQFMQSAGAAGGGYMFERVGGYEVGSTTAASWLPSSGVGDGLTGRTTTLNQEILEIDPAKFGRKSWNWRGRPPTSAFLLDPPSEVTIRILAENLVSARPTSQLLITHSGVPVEFAAGLLRYWPWQFQLFNTRDDVW